MRNLSTLGQLRVYARFMTPCICTNLRLAARRLSTAYDAALAPLNINIAQYFLLRTIGEQDSLSLTRLGELAELERSTVGRNVRVLERMDLVVTERGESDQREALVSLTSGGRSLLKKALPIWQESQKRIERRLGTHELKALTNLLAEI